MEQTFWFAFPARCDGRRGDVIDKPQAEAMIRDWGASGIREYWQHRQTTYQIFPILSA
jgi:hypothetical protein